MDEILKELLIELGDAASESVNDSEKVSAIRERLDKIGYNISIELGLAIVFNKKSGQKEGLATNRGKKTPTKLKLTNQDRKFFRALKIAWPDEE